MSKEGHAVALLSGELTVEQRAAVIKRFREGKEKVLITTNVSARGIHAVLQDIGGIVLRAHLRRNFCFEFKQVNFL